MRTYESNLLVDPIEIAINLPAGLIIPMNVVSKDTKQIETVFLVREDNNYIRKLGKNPKFEIRNTVTIKNGVAALFNMLMINKNLDLTYDFWLNYYEQEQQQFLKNLSSQERLIFIFINEKGQIPRKIMIPNNLRIIVQSYNELSKLSGSWSMFEFDLLKQEFYAANENPYLLWDKLSN